MSNTQVLEKPVYQRKNLWSCLYGFQEVLPGLLAMFFIAIFSNNLLGVPNPFTLENLFAYLDRVIGPVNGQHFFQIMNSNFVWNSFLLGFLIANILGVPDSWKRGLSYIHKLMPLGIIMLAPHFILGHAAKAGWGIVFFAFLLMLLTSSCTILLGRLFKVDDRHSADIAGALATGDPHVCAILMPMLKAKGGQVINSVLCVLAFGVIASFLLPVLGSVLGLSQEAFGLASVLGVGNGAQAFRAAFDFGYEAGRFSRYYDVVRHVIMPAGFLYVFFFMFIRRIRRGNDPEVHATRGLSGVPPYVVVFIVCWFLAWIHVFKAPAQHVIFEMVRWDFSLAAAALGLSLPWREIARWGLRGFALTCAAGAIRIVVLLAALWGMIKAGWF
jgi:uncharacterized membrane protein YadS